VILLAVENDEITESDTVLRSLKVKTRAPVIVVLNKADLIHKSQIQNHKSQIRTINVSALKRTGIDQLRKEILNACKLDGFRHKPGQPIIFSRKQLSLIY